MIIDTPNDTTRQVPHLLADGVTTVMRYLTLNKSSPKLVTPAEARTLAAASIRLGLVYEVYGGSLGHNDISRSDGLTAAQFCLEYVPTLGAPTDGTVCIFFACDRDFPASQIKSMVLPYFGAIADELDGAGYLVGVYGSGAVCGAVRSAATADYAWLSGSLGWTGSRAYLAARPEEMRLVQDKMDTRLANMDVDTDIAMGEFGDFLPFAHQVAA